MISVAYNKNYADANILWSKLYHHYACEESFTEISYKMRYNSLWL